MKLERKIWKDLEEWKDSADKRCLVIKGARQVGKTWIIKEFAKTYYENVVYLNFWTNEDYKKIFTGSLEINKIIEKMSYYLNEAKFVEGKTVIILDEVQECDNAYGSLRFFYEDKRFDVVATGSLLGLKSMNFTPLGSVTYLNMHSLDFEEFLWANKLNKEHIENLRKYYTNPKLIIPDAINDLMNEYFTKYILIGGMPSAVASYVEFKNLSLVKKIHSDILMGYEDDINKHAGDKLKNKILSCFKSIPSQLSKDNTKFMFNLVKKNAKFERYEDCFKWLELAGIIICVNNLTDVSLPLSSCALKHNFKIYLKDTGLLISLLGPDGYDDIINNDIKVFKGAIYENVFADLIVKKNIVPYFFDQSKGFEIDFVTTINSKLNLLEVKSSNNRTKSIKTFFSEYKNKLKNFKCYKFIKGKSGVCEEFSTLPHWMLMFL